MSSKKMPSNFLLFIHCRGRWAIPVPCLPWAWHHRGRWVCSPLKSYGFDLQSKIGSWTFMDNIFIYIYISDIQRFPATFHCRFPPGSGHMRDMFFVSLGPLYFPAQTLRWLTAVSNMSDTMKRTEWFDWCSLHFKNDICRYCSCSNLWSGFAHGPLKKWLTHQIWSETGKTPWQPGLCNGTAGLHKIFKLVLRAINL